MKYFEWLGDLNRIDITFPSSHFRERWWMAEGQHVEGWDPDLVAHYTVPEALEFNFGYAKNGWRLFSPAFRSWFDQLHDGLIQFLPFRLRLRENEVVESLGYCVGQILNLVDCLNRDRTTVRDNWKEINSIGDFGVIPPFALSKKLIGNHKLFRIKGKSISIVMREDLRQEMEDAGFTGQRFDDIEVT